jgi:hypothetical protein
VSFAKQNLPETRIKNPRRLTTAIFNREIEKVEVVFGHSKLFGVYRL